jgi:hypothetical protein
MFAHAISSTATTAAVSTRSAGRTSPVNCSRIGTTRDVHPVLKSGNLRVNSADTRVMSACAPSNVMPGLRRATVVIERPRGVRDCAVKPMGNQTSTVLSRNENVGGITPTTVYGVACETIER